jgi:hypothetical protein
MWMGFEGLSSFCLRAHVLCMLIMHKYAPRPLLFLLQSVLPNRRINNRSHVEKFNYINKLERSKHVSDEDEIIN